MDHNQMTARPSRRNRACKQCRASKVRCSGTRPCARCVRRRDVCAFLSDEAQVTVPQQYLRELERQAAAATLESVASSSGSGVRPSATSTIPSATTSVTIAPTVTTAPVSIRPPTRIHNDHPRSTGVPRAYNPLVNRSIAYVRGCDARRLLFLGHTSTWSFCRRAFSLLEEAAGSPDSRRAPLHLDGAALQNRLRWQAKANVDADDLTRLPPADHARFLFHTVQFRLGELFAVVDEAAFLARFEAFQQAPLATATAHRLWFVEYLLVLAFGMAYTSPTTLVSGSVGPPGCDLAARALSLLPDVAFLQDERPAMQALEVFFLAALYLKSVDMRSPAYQYSGQALRLALHDGLHREVELSEELSEEDTSMEAGLSAGLAARCSSVWWAVYVLDQDIAADLGCPPAIAVDSITTPLPTVHSSTLSAKALSLRVRLAGIVSSICSTVYDGMDGTFGADFICSITSVLHSLADVSADMEAVMVSVKAARGELPHMFCNVTLAYHYCILLATRPLVIWLLIRCVPLTGTSSAGGFDPQVLAQPIAQLLKTSAQSAATTLLILKSLADRGMMEAFLPFHLEYAFSSAVLLSMLDALLPGYVPEMESADGKGDWRAVAERVFADFASKGNVVVGLRTTELKHLQELLVPLRRGSAPETAAVTPLSPPPTGTEAGTAATTLQAQASVYESEGLPGDQRDHDDHGLDSSLDIFVTGTDDILALAAQLEEGDFPYTFPFS
ncbi:hypothetical protein SBRCBS47491_008043 [Sporothrix bragantina]|uniref:Zn(2)-C6 fungal-type domain-containing protein n=1 Tax=Sporothrix bragantina TaxID=671064 RepID=A0ABP0CIK3_9PEZI